MKMGNRREKQPKKGSRGECPWERGLGGGCGKGRRKARLGRGWERVKGGREWRVRRRGDIGEG